MNGRCICCYAVLGTGDVGGICQSCRDENNQKNTAQYRTYENGFSDGYKKAHEELQDAYKKIGEMISNRTQYIVVTQEQYDKLIAEELRKNT